MASRGDAETNKLRINIENQLERLMTQLNDLEDMREELDEEEYNTTKQETLDQLKEFQNSLEKSKDGSMSLVDTIGSIQLKIQETISSAVQATDASSKFVNKGACSSLRGKLEILENEYKMKKITPSTYKIDLLGILKQIELADTLNDHEKGLLSFAKNVDGESFVKTNDINENSNVLNSAGLKI